MKNIPWYMKAFAVLSLSLVSWLAYSILTNQGGSVSSFFNRDLAQVYRNSENLNVITNPKSGTVETPLYNTSSGMQVSATGFSGKIILNSASAVSAYLPILQLADPNAAAAFARLAAGKFLDREHYVSLQLSRGSIVESVLHWPTCTMPVEVAHIGKMAELYKESGGPCAPASVAKSIIKVLGVPPEVYADDKNFKQDFLDNVVKSETHANMDAVKRMHENYTYNDSTFACGRIFGPTDITAPKNTRETEFKDVCSYINDRLNENQDCVMGFFDAVDNPKTGHSGMITGVTYDDTKKACQVSISRPGTSEEWKANGYNTGPHSPGNDVWDIKVGGKKELNAFPFKMTPVKTDNNKLWAKEGYKNYNYFCCKKVSI